VPILNYTTEISTTKTAGEIQAALVRARAQAIMMEYDEAGVLTHISFRKDTEQGIVAFRLPANVAGVYQAMKADKRVTRRMVTMEQAARVAWRIVKVWVEAQLAIIDAGMATLPEVFLPYAQLPSGETVYDRFNRQGLAALTHDPKRLLPHDT
jgi:hypothetical protein